MGKLWHMLIVALFLVGCGSEQMTALASTPTPTDAPTSTTTPTATTTPLPTATIIPTLTPEPVYEWLWGEEEPSISVETVKELEASDGELHLVWTENSADYNLDISIPDGLVNSQGEIIEDLTWKTEIAGQIDEAGEEIEETGITVRDENGVLWGWFNIETGEVDPRVLEVIPVPEPTMPKPNWAIFSGNGYAGEHQFEDPERFDYFFVYGKPTYVVYENWLGNEVVTLRVEIGNGNYGSFQCLLSIDPENKALSAKFYDSTTLPPGDDFVMHQDSDQTQEIIDYIISNGAYVYLSVPIDDEEGLAQAIENDPEVAQIVESLEHISTIFNCPFPDITASQVLGKNTGLSNLSNREVDEISDTLRNGGGLPAGLNLVSPNLFIIRE